MVTVPKLVLLGGPTGVGKSTTLKLLESRLPKLALLDADDVWRVSEDLAVDGTRSIAISNVVNVLNGYRDAGCDTAVLSWVFARSALFGPAVEALTGTFDVILQIYLVASPDALRARLESRNDLDRLAYSISRLKLIERLPYRRIDTTNLSAYDTAERVLELIDAG